MRPSPHETRIPSPCGHAGAGERAFPPAFPSAGQSLHRGGDMRRFPSMNPAGLREDRQVAVCRTTVRPCVLLTSPQLSGTAGIVTSMPSHGKAQYSTAKSGIEAILFIAV